MEDKRQRFLDSGGNCIAVILRDPEVAGHRCHRRHSLRGDPHLLHRFTKLGLQPNGLCFEGRRRNSQARTLGLFLLVIPGQFVRAADSLG